MCYNSSMGSQVDPASIKAFEEEFKALRDKYHLELSMSMTFPQFNILPPDLRLAIHVINLHHPVYVAAYQGKA